MSDNKDIRKEFSDELNNIMFKILYDARRQELTQDRFTKYLANLSFSEFSKILDVLYFRNIEGTKEKFTKAVRKVFKDQIKLPKVLISLILDFTTLSATEIFARASQQLIDWMYRPDYVII